MKSISVEKANRMIEHLGTTHRRMVDRLNVAIEDYNKVVDYNTELVNGRLVTYQCVGCGDIVKVNMGLYVGDEKIRKHAEMKVCKTCYQQEVDSVMEMWLKDKIYNADSVEVVRVGDKMAIYVDGVVLWSVGEVIE